LLPSFLHQQNWVCVFRIRIKSHLTAAAREHNGNQYNSAACVVENLSATIGSSALLGFLRASSCSHHSATKSCYDYALLVDAADDLQCSMPCHAHGRQLRKPVERRRTFQLRRRQEMNRFMSAVLHKSNSNTHWQSIRNGVLSSAVQRVMVSGGKTNCERTTSPQTHQNRFNPFLFGAFKSAAINL
jgi:hypothetical protein